MLHFVWAAVILLCKVSNAEKCSHRSWFVNTYMPVTEGVGSILATINTGLQLSILYNLTYTFIPLRLAHEIQASSEDLFAFEAYQRDRLKECKHYSFDRLLELLEDKRIQAVPFAK